MVARWASFVYQLIIANRWGTFARVLLREAVAQDTNIVPPPSVFEALFPYYRRVCPAPGDDSGEEEEEEEEEEP